MANQHTDAPKLTPWNGFELERDSAYGFACREIAILLADDLWHDRTQITNVIAGKVLDLKRKTIVGLINELKNHGDIRQRGNRIRLTTRWSDAQK